DAANPRGRNRFGHVLELTPPADEHGRPVPSAARFRWEGFLLCGDPREAKSQTRYGEGTSENGWLGCPDNCAFDPRGRLWIATDGADGMGFCDGVFACDTSGPGRALTRQLFRGPVGCEICGPCFTPDGKTLFVAIQHPGEINASGKFDGVSFSNPGTRWPD